VIAPYCKGKDGVARLRPPPNAITSNPNVLPKPKFKPVFPLRPQNPQGITK
jgi:hypothetical protein